MNIELKTYQTIKSFIDDVEGHLLKNPILHSMLLSLIKKYLLQNKPIHFMGMLKNIDNDELIAGIQTEPERAIILSKGSVSLASQFALNIYLCNPSIPGANGPLETVETFSKEWQILSNCSIEIAMNMRLFELKNLIPPSTPSGHWRPANVEDIEHVIKWIKEFHNEASPHDPKQSDENLRKTYLPTIKANKVHLWVDHNIAVSMVMNSRETDHEGWIAPVYTPKQYRGKGYASKLTAIVSEIILQQGKRVVLFTDQANPTSNSIYQKIGYRPVSDFKHILFSSTEVIDGNETNYNQQKKSGLK